jgi:hypothetical protein
MNLVWCDFRDGFGAVWTLRVAQRVNESATRHQWPVTLDWQGFIDRHSGQPAEELPAEVVENLRTLLRRFVSNEWIDKRLDSR